MKGFFLILPLSLAIFLPTTLRAQSTELGSLGEAAPDSIISSESTSGYSKLSSAKIRVYERKAKKKKKPKKPKKPVAKVSFAGTWILTLNKTQDTCPGSTTPSVIVDRFVISNTLVGTDTNDNSPFFTGKVSGNTITFGRARTSSSCRISQILQIVSADKKSGSSGVRSELVCPNGSCYTIYTGPAKKQ